GLQKLHDKLQQVNNQNSQLQSIKRQATSQTQNASENNDYLVYIDDELNNPFTTVNKRQNNQKRKIQRGDQYDFNTNNYNYKYDDAYNTDKQRKTNNYRIYTRRKKINENTVETTNTVKNDLCNYMASFDKKTNTRSYSVNNEASSYAVDMHLTPLRIKCDPSLSDRNTTLKFVKEFFKRIENSFRSICTDHKKTLGFEYWWIDSGGDLMGITNDISLYVYLCNVRHYPQQIDSVRITPLFKGEKAEFLIVLIANDLQ
ncbi:unnamed protein product, partial [Rotaria sp. Silwood2]